VTKVQSTQPASPLITAAGRSSIAREAAGPHLFWASLTASNRYGKSSRLTTYGIGRSHWNIARNV